MEFRLTVQVSDKGTVLKMWLLLLFLLVSLMLMIMSPYENMPPVSSGCTISALDFDTGPCGYLSYSIQSSSLSSHGTVGDHNLFIIDSLSGDILSKQVLDFEHQSKYCFIAQARDRSNSTATVTVQINVEGLDEFDPVFMTLERIITGIIC